MEGAFCFIHRLILHCFIPRGNRMTQDERRALADLLRALEARMDHFARVEDLRRLSPTGEIELWTVYRLTKRTQRALDHSETPSLHLSLVR